MNKFKIFMVVMMAITANIAFAADIFYYSFNVKANVYPSGAGKVYVGRSLKNPVYSSTSSTFKGAISGTELAVAAMPNSGYVFSAWVWKNGNIVTPITTDERDWIDFSKYAYKGQYTKGEAKSDSIDAVKHIPGTTTDVYAMFAKVSVRHAEGQGRYGAIGIDPVDNTMGSTVTISATPMPGTKFEKWTFNGQTVSTNPTYTFTVDKVGLYVAHFSGTPTGN